MLDLDFKVYPAWLSAIPCYFLSAACVRVHSDGTSLGKPLDSVTTKILGWGRQCATDKHHLLIFITIMSESM